MAAFICRMCGAPLELKAGDRISRCPACGAVQTVPMIDSEDKAEMCASAERYRREYRYDKAIAIYEELIRAYPTDADLYWSMLLCRYGVEYIADGEQSRISLNRTSARSLLADEDYRMALRYADSEQRALMTAGATEIDNARRRIVELSRNGGKYDIYLCCRERDERGMRTPDHAAAKDICNRLTAEGFSVFFPDVTLEDVSGSELEPYIYAALDSARIMIVMGMSEESFSDVWVSNAYSRFARIAAEDSRRVLIPMFRGVGADALPELLKPYQALDMSRLGYANDLVTSVCSILGRRAAPVQQNDMRSDPMLRRAYLQLQDGEFDEAAQTARKLLEENSDNAEAYLVLLMAEYRTAAPESLGVDLSVSENYRNAMRCGSEGFRLRLRGMLSSSLYLRYRTLLDEARNEQTCREAAEGFRMLGDHADSAALAEAADRLADELHQRAEQERSEMLYSRALQIFSNTSSGTTELMHAERTFRELGDYRDSKVLADKCRRRIEKITAEIRAVEAGFYTDSGALSRKVVVIIAVVIAVLVTLAAIVVLFAVQSSNGPHEDRTEQHEITTSAVTSANSRQEILDRLYGNDAILDKAEGMIAEGDLDGALDELDTLPDNLTEQQELRERYLRATVLLERGEYIEAKAAFEALGSYQGARNGIKECDYRRALELLEEGDTAIASKYLEQLDGYKDSEDILNDMKYSEAMTLLDSGDREGARVLFGELGDFRNAPEYFGSISCEMAEELLSENRFEASLEMLVEAWDYPLAKEMYPDFCLRIAEDFLSRGKTGDALKYLDYGLPHDKTGRLAQVMCNAVMSILDYDTADYIMPRLYLTKLYRIDGYQVEAVSGFCYIGQRLYDKGEYDEVIDMLSPYRYYDNADALCDMAQQALDLEASGVMAPVTSATTPATTTTTPTEAAPTDEPTLINPLAEQLVADCGVGTVFTFGSYEQDGNSANGAEPIEWVVYENDGEKLHAVSVNSLFQASFGRSGSWAKSTLRGELNGWFLETAFTEEERQCLTGANTDLRDPLMNDLVRVIETGSFSLIPHEYRVSPMSEALQDEAGYNVDDPASWCVSKEQPHIPLIISGTGRFVHATQDDLDKDIIANVRVVITISAE